VYVVLFVMMFLSEIFEILLSQLYITVNKLCGHGGQHDMHYAALPAISTLYSSVGIL